MRLVCSTPVQFQFNRIRLEAIIQYSSMLGFRMTMDGRTKQSVVTAAFNSSGSS